MTYVVNDMELQIKNWQHLIKSAVLIPFLSSLYMYVLIHNPKTKLGFYSKENQFPQKQLNTGTWKLSIALKNKRKLTEIKTNIMKYI